MNKLLNSIRNAWFKPVNPRRLAVIRIATGLFCLWYVLSRFEMLQRMVKNSTTFEPIGILAWMEQPLDSGVFWWLSVLLIGLNICYIIGWKFRFTGPAFALLALLFFTYRNSWSMIYHNHNALILHILILGLVSSANAYSIDSWIANKKGKGDTTPHWRYGWPIMLICALTVGSYFLSGVAKIAGDLAWDWFTGNAMRSQIAVDTIRKSILGAETTPLFNTIYKHTWLFLGMGIFTFIVELGAPLALYSKRWGRLWALLAFGMHWGIFFTMGITFRYQMTGLVFLSFLEPEKWFTNARSKLVSRGDGNVDLTKKTDTSPIILFDGVCTICNGWVRFVLKKEGRTRFRFASLQSNSAQELLSGYGLKDGMNSIVLIEGGALYQKSEAVLRIFSRLKYMWPLLSVFLIVPRVIRDGIYDTIARNRYYWFGKQSSCELGNSTDKLRFIEP